MPVFAGPPKQEMPGTLEGFTETFNVRLPYSVNTVRVPADKELILKWNVVAKEEAAKRDKTWVDDVRKVETKRAKGSKIT